MALKASENMNDMRENLPALELKASDGRKDGPSMEGKEFTLPACLASEKIGGSKVPMHRRQRLLEAVGITKSFVEKNGSQDSEPNTLFMVASVLSMQEIYTLYEGGNVQDEKARNLLADLCYLLSMTLQEVSRICIRLRWKQIVEISTKALQLNAGDELCCRAFCSISASVISSVDSQSWSTIELSRCYNQMLMFGIDERSRVQHRARDALTALYNGHRGEAVAKKFSKTSSAFMLEALQGDDSSISLRALSLGYIVCHKLSKKDTYEVALAVLDVASKRAPVISSACLEYLSKLILDVELAAGDEETEVMSSLSEDHAVIFAKKMSKLPPLKTFDSSTVAAQVAAYAASATTLYSVRKTDSQVLASFCRTTVTSISKMENLGEGLDRISSALEQVVSAEGQNGSPGVLSELEKLLSEQFKPVWDHLLKPLALFLELNAHGASNVTKKMTDTVKRVISLFNDVADTEPSKPLEGVLAALLRGGGANVLLNSADITETEGDERIGNAWIFPLISDHLDGSSLQIFGTKILPIHKRLMERASREEGEESLVAAKNTRIIAAQVWSSFVGFCLRPLDFDEQIMRAGSVIASHVNSDDAVMASFALKALRNLALSVESQPTDSKSFTEFLKKMMPVLLTTTQKQSSQRRDDYLSCIEECFSHGNQFSVLAGSFLKRALKKVLEHSAGKGESSEMAESSIDIALAIVRSQALEKNAPEILLFYRTILPILNDPSDITLQKKAYKAMSQLVRLNILTVPKDLITALDEAGSSAAIGSKASRLTCIETVLRVLEPDDLIEATTKFIVEIILYSRDVSLKARESANRALISVARQFNNVFHQPLSSENSNSEGGVERFLNILFAGLAGRNASMLSATITAIARVLYEFRLEIGMDSQLAKVVKSLFIDVESMSTEPGPATMLLSNENREVVRSSLGLFKVISVVLDANELKDLLNCIVPPLMNVADNSKKDLRLRVKIIMERLLRKCGREAMEEAFPVEHAIFLRNIRRQLNRREKRKSRKQLSGFDHALEGSEDENAAEDAMTTTEFKTAKTGITANTLRTNKTARTAASRAVSRAGSRLSMATTLLPDMNQVTKEARSQLRLKDTSDLLAGKVSTVLTDRELKSRKRRDDVFGDDSDDPTAGGGYIIAEDGRPIFKESESESEAAEAGSQDGDAGDNDAGYTTMRRSESVAGGKGSRKRRPLKGVNLGEEFKSRRGAGDVKRKNRPDPYAYIPLAPAAFSSSHPKSGASLLQHVAQPAAKRRRTKR